MSASTSSFPRKRTTLAVIPCNSVAVIWNKRETKKKNKKLYSDCSCESQKRFFVRFILSEQRTINLQNYRFARERRIKRNRCLSRLILNTSFNVKRNETTIRSLSRAANTLDDWNEISVSTRRLRPRGELKRWYHYPLFFLLLEKIRANKIQSVGREQRGWNGRHTFDRTFKVIKITRLPWLLSKQRRVGETSISGE